MAVLSFLFNWFIKLTGWIPQLLAFRTKVYFEDKKVQDRRIRGKAILVSNHRALMDFGLLLYVFYRRTLRCVVAEVMYKKNPFMSVFLFLAGTIRVDREDHDFSFLGKCRKILDGGGVVEIFPEARLPKRGEPLPLPFKPSTVYLALESGAPIIPVYHDGVRYFSKRVSVIVGTPMCPRELYDETLSEKENIHFITEQLRSKIIELEQELNRQQNRETAGQ